MESIRRSRELGDAGGFAYAGIGTLADLARTLAYLGDAEQALALADRSLEIAAERIPPGISVAQVARAEALLALGDRAAARDALDGLEVSLPEPERTYALAGSALAGSRLALADGDPAEASAVAIALVEGLRSRGVRILLADALVALARARIAEGRDEEAERLLADAIGSADRLGERKSLWEALALSAGVLARRGAERDAAALRRRARGIVEDIAAGISDEDLRGRFLARDDVRALAAPGR
jgi:tetratricopeptide (TPR) repeat protein